MKLIVGNVFKIEGQNVLATGAGGNEFELDILNKIIENKKCVAYKNDDKTELNIIDVSISYSLIGDVLIGIKFTDEVDEDRLLGGEIRVE